MTRSFPERRWLILDIWRRTPSTPIEIYMNQLRFKGFVGSGADGKGQTAAAAWMRLMTSA